MATMLTELSPSVVQQPGDPQRTGNTCRAGRGPRAPAPPPPAQAQPAAPYGHSTSQPVPRGHRETPHTPRTAPVHTRHTACGHCATPNTRESRPPPAQLPEGPAVCAVPDLTPTTRGRDQERRRRQIKTKVKIKVKVNIKVKVKVKVKTSSWHRQASGQRGTAHQPPKPWHRQDTRPGRNHTTPPPKPWHRQDAPGTGQFKGHRAWRLDRGNHRGTPPHSLQGFRRVAPVHCCTGAPSGPRMHVPAHAAQASR
jgi:hypothetical protein